jgi:hypothetical protein
LTYLREVRPDKRLRGDALLEGRISWGRPHGGAYFMRCEYTLSKGL